MKTKNQRWNTWPTSGLIAICMLAISAIAGDGTSIIQARGIDARVDYAALQKLGPWDDRNYQLTQEDLAILHPDEQPHPVLPIYHRIQYWKSQSGVTPLPLYPDFVELQFLREKIEPQAIITAAGINALTNAPDYRPTPDAKNSPPSSLNIPLNSSSLNQCVIKANPAAPRQSWALAACNGQNGGVQVFLTRSLDSTVPAWQRVASTVNGLRGDASLVWSSDGERAWLSTAELVGETARPAVYRMVFAATGDPQLTGPVFLGAGVGEKPRLHLHPGSPDRLYAVWQSNLRINFATADPDGLSWSVPLEISGPFVLSADLNSSPSGDLLLSYVTALTPQGAICTSAAPCQVGFGRSTNNGASFTLEAVQPPAFRGRDGGATIPAARTRAVRYYTRAAAAPASGAVFPGRIYLTWNDLSEQTPAQNPPSSFESNNIRLRIAFRDPAGAWTPVPAPSPAPPSTQSCLVNTCIDNFNHELVVDHNGVIHLTWQDTRLSGASRDLVDVYYAYSRNGGASWLPTPNFRVTTVSSPIPTTTQQWGDYAGLTIQRPAVFNGTGFAPNRLISVWTDSRDNPAQTRGYFGIFDVVSNPFYTWTNLGGQPSTFVCRNATITRNLRLETDLQVLRPMALSILTGSADFSSNPSLSVQSLTPNPPTPDPSSPATLTVPVLGTTASHNVGVVVRASDSLIGQQGVIARTDIFVPIEIRRENQRPVIATPTVATFEPSLRVQPTNGTTLVREGNAATDVINVSLAGPPGPTGGATAIYTVVNPNLSRFTVSPTTLTFTQSNWNTPQAVTVTQVDNSVADGDIIVSVEFRGADTNPAGFRDNFFTDVSVIDDDRVQLVVSEPSGTLNNRFVEGGSTFYSLSLSSQPSGNVTATVTADPALRINGQQTLTLAFTPQNFATGQVVTVTAVNDNVARGIYRANITHVLSGSAPYAGVPAPTVDVEVTDDDQAGVELVGAVADVTEGGQLTYTLRLASQPTATVTITPTVAAGTTGVTLSTPLAFTPANWNIAQTVTITTIDDQLVQGRREAYVRNVVSSADSFYALTSLASSFGFSIIDNDVAPPGASGLQLSLASLTVTEGQAAQTYTVRLSSQPNSNVLVDVLFDQAQLTVNGNATGTVLLTFTSVNWNTPQTVSVLAVNDDVREQTISRSIAHRVNSMNASSVVVTITDNDTTLPAAITPAVAIPEGSSANLVVNLGTRPRSPVTIRALGDSELGVPATTEVQPQNWQTPVNIAVSALADSIWEGPHAGHLRAVLESDDPNFSGRLISVPVQITNTNVLGIESTRTPPSSSLPEGGGSVTWSYRLRSQPKRDVVLQVNGGLELCVGSSSNLGGCPTAVGLTFTQANWNTAQVVFVGARDDSRAERPAIQQGSPIVNDLHTGFLKLQYRTTDDKYGRVTGINPTLETILDNDAPLVLPDHNRYTLTINWQMPPLLFNESQPTSYPWGLNLVSPSSQVRAGTATAASTTPFAGTVTFTQNTQTPIAQRLYPLNYRFDVRGVNPCDGSQTSLFQQLSFSIPVAAPQLLDTVFRDGFEAF